jgi:hypothetical protein
MAHARHYLPFEDFLVRRPFNIQDTGKAFFHARQRVVNERVVAGNVDLEVDDHRAACRHCHGLNALERLGLYAAQRIDPVKNLTNEMKG